MEEYIDTLLYVDLNKKNIEVILKQLRKLNWKDPNVEDYAIQEIFRMKRTFMPSKRNYLLI